MLDSPKRNHSVRNTVFMGHNTGKLQRRWSSCFRKVAIAILAAVPLFSQARANEAVVDLEAGLVSYWPLNQKGGSVVEDVSGNGHDGTLVDFPQDPWIDGKEDGGLAFQGNGFVEVRDLPKVETTTWAAFLKKREPNNYASPITATFEGAAAGHILGYKSGDAANHPRVLWNHDVDTTGLSSPDPVPLNEWRHVAMTLDAASGELKLYVDGKLLDPTRNIRRCSRGR